MKTIWIILAILISLPCALPSAAAEGESKNSDSGMSEAERVNVDSIKEKYWARGDESEMGVVQNRMYSKARKFELGVFVGVPISDPFLSVKNLGTTLGFHFSEYFSAHLIWWKDYVGPSSALKTLQETLDGTTTNKNEPRAFLGVEASASVLYGKLSLVGKKIIYYDFHLLAGMGRTFTEEGKYFTPMAGIGQQVFISKSVSLRVDYRAQTFQENIIEKVIAAKRGEVYSRRNWTHAVTFGVDILFGF